MTISQLLDCKHLGILEEELKGTGRQSEARSERMASPLKRRRYEYEGDDLVDTPLLHRVAKHVRYNRLRDFTTYLYFPSEQSAAATAGDITHEEQVKQVSNLHNDTASLQFGTTFSIFQRQLTPMLVTEHLNLQKQN